MKHDTITAPGNWRAELVRARNEAATSAVAAYPDLARTAALLPTPYIVRLMHELNEQLSFSYGYDVIDRGLDLVSGDLRAETLRNDEPGLHSEALL